MSDRATERENSHTLLCFHLSVSICAEVKDMVFNILLKFMVSLQAKCFWGCGNGRNEFWCDTLRWHSESPRLDPVCFPQHHPSQQPLRECLKRNEFSAKQRIVEGKMICCTSICDNCSLFGQNDQLGQRRWKAVDKRMKMLPSLDMFFMTVFPTFFCTGSWKNSEKGIGPRGASTSFSNSAASLSC